MILQGKDMSYEAVRKFVVDFYMLEFADYVLYTAFTTPTDNLFCQPRDSDDWKLLDSVTTRYDLQNQSKY